jgi:hypothetical protein
VLAAKAVVIGAVAFASGLAASVTAVGIGVPKEENQGQVLLNVPVVTEARVIVGTAAVVMVVLPFLMAGLNIVPASVGARLTPTAGLAIQQSIPRYPQVTTVLDPVRGYYPLSPYAGFAVMCLWAAAALGLAFILLRRRDA